MSDKHYIPSADGKNKIKVSVPTKLDELKDLINHALSHCNSILHPEVCKMKATKEGFAKLETEILKRCVETGKTVGQVMNEIEKEYNPNLADD